MDLATLRAWLGDEAHVLDAPLPPGLVLVPRARLPGPDHLDRNWLDAAPNGAWLRSFHALLAAGRPGGTGLLVLLAAAGDAALRVRVAEEGGCSGVVLSPEELDSVGLRAAHRAPVVARVEAPPSLAWEASGSRAADLVRRLRLAGAVGVSLAGAAASVARLAHAAAGEGLVALVETPDGLAPAALPGLALTWPGPAGAPLDALRADAAPPGGRAAPLARAALDDRRRALAISVLARRAGAMGIVIDGALGTDADTDVATLHAVQDAWDAPAVPVG